MDKEKDLLVLYPYIRDGIISHGRAAEILGIPKWDLIERYAQLGFPYFNMDIQEIEKEVSDWENLKNSTYI